MSFIISIFDEDNGPGLWLKEPPADEANSPVLCIGNFVKGSFDQVGKGDVRCFQMTEKGVFYTKNAQESKVRGYISFKWVRSEFNEEQGVYQISFIRNKKLTQIVTKDKQTWENWMEHLRKFTIQTDFHERYNALKQIGQGSFAKVYLVEERQSKQKFAVKAFSKSFIET
jgi:hypothetical protein